MKTLIQTTSSPDCKIRKSIHDCNSYYSGKLENGINFIIISDSSTDKSAASLHVKVGSIYDPPDCLGLAHFLEHALFLGTAKYPGHNDFNDFLSKNREIQTRTLPRTRQTFISIFPIKEFEKGLDMFSQFFISPWFTETWIQHEIEAVDSEHMLDIRNDYERWSNLHMSEGYTESQFSKFMCGNSDTLCQENIRDRVMEFYQKHYHTNKMFLSVFSNKSIENLKEIIAATFGKVQPSIDCHPRSEETLRTWYDKNNMCKSSETLEHSWTLLGDQYEH